MDGFIAKNLIAALTLAMANASWAQDDEPVIATANDPVSIVVPPDAERTRPLLRQPETQTPPRRESQPLGAATRGLPPATGDAESGGTLVSRLDPRRNEILRVGGALGVVLLLLVLTRTLFRRAGMLNGGSRPSGVVEVLARYPIARGQQLVLLKLARRVLLVHQGGNAMSTLAELREPAEVASLLSRIEAGSKSSDAARFNSVLKRFEREHGRQSDTRFGAELDAEIVDLDPRPKIARGREDPILSSLRRSPTLIAVTAAVVLAAPAAAQSSDLNPISILEGAVETLPGSEGGLSGALNIILLLTVLTLAPAIMVLCTCFTRIVIVMGLLRQALGTQGLPPSQVVVGLSLFITLVVMAPTAERMYEEGIGPYARGEIRDHEVAWEKSKQPLRDFMFAQIDAGGNWSSVFMILEYRGVDVSEPQDLQRSDVDMLSLVPAYILSELKIAFLMGFRIYLPFLVIDMVIASMLISMGMLMLPPVLISLPFKLLLFVMVDGWQLIVGTLMTSVIQPESVVAMSAVGMMGLT